jgi:hypothetical protein
VSGWCLDDDDDDEIFLEEEDVYDDGRDTVLAGITTE